MQIQSGKFFFLTALLFNLFFAQFAIGQIGVANKDPKIVFPDDAYSHVGTYINPVLPGDHPDPTLFKFGNDYYMCGSSFHFVPNMPILHSRDLLHWETIARVVPAGWDELKSGAPSAGTWQGAITWFYGSFYIYFSNSAGGGQYFSKASTPYGPWSKPVKMMGNNETGPIGYDNSVFVDDDGTPYMIIKPGQTTNRIQQIGRDGNLTGSLINMDWLNRYKKYSWAEGPVMGKRDGWYYYFMAGDVTGGQYVLRSKTLTGDSAKWENLGKVFSFSMDPENRFRSANHMSSPFKLNDGTWWCIAQSYDAPKGDDWSGQGRQDLLLQVQWTADGKPYVPYPSEGPLIRPALSNSGLSWRLPRSDYFNNSELGLSWHFLNKTAASQNSLTVRPDWLHLDPKGGRSHILQKEAGRSYALVTRVTVDARKTQDGAGFYLCSGNESVNVRLYSGYDSVKKIIFTICKQQFSITNTVGETVWLKLERNEHNLTGYYSADGIKWIPVGGLINARELDKSQPNFNSWVGTSMGLYAEGTPADFDLFLYKDGFTALPIAGSNNYFGASVTEGGLKVLAKQGGWAMLGGVDFGRPGKKALGITIAAAALSGCSIEIWIDDLNGNGKRIAAIPVTATKSLDSFRKFSANITPIQGQHDLYIKIKKPVGDVILKTVNFY